MSTTYIRDIRQAKRLPIKEIHFDYTDATLAGDIIVIGDLIEGAEFSVEPILTADEYGNDVAVAYKLHLKAGIIQTNLETIKSSLTTLASNASFKRLIIVFNNTVNYNVDASGERLVLSTGDSEGGYDLGKSVYLTMEYQDDTPVVFVNVNVTLNTNMYNYLFTQINWNNPTW